MAGPHLEDGPRAQDKTSDIWDVQVASGGRHANGRTKDELMERAMHVWVRQRILEGPCTITQAAPRNHSHTRVPSRGSHNSPFHNINMTVLCHRFRLRPKFFKNSEECASSYGRFGHLSTKITIIAKRYYSLNTWSFSNLKTGLCRGR